MTIYDRIKQLREQQGLSQQALAEKVGFKTASAVNKIELGLRDINQSKIIAFAKALNTTPAYLMGWEENKSDYISDSPINTTKNNAKSYIRDDAVIGNLIRDRRKNLGLTLENVAKAVGISEDTVKKWEDGDLSSMRRDEIIDLSTVLSISPISLITGELIEVKEDDEFKTLSIRAYNLDNKKTFQKSDIITGNDAEIKKTTEMLLKLPAEKLSALLTLLSKDEEQGKK